MVTEKINKPLPLIKYYTSRTKEPIDVQIPGSNVSIQSLAHIIKKVVGFKQIKIEVRLLLKTLTSDYFTLIQLQLQNKHW
jgi:hypothetical protein